MESSCIVITGERGAGKSTTFALMSETAKKQGRDVYCQFPYEGVHMIPVVAERIKNVTRFDIDKDWLYSHEFEDGAWGSRCFNCSVGLDRPMEFPLKAIGAPDIGYFYDEDDLWFTFSKEVEKDTTYTYQGSKIVQYDISGSTVNQIIDYKQGNIKRTSNFVQHGDFAELVVDENDG